MKIKYLSPNNAETVLEIAKYVLERAEIREMAMDHFGLDEKETLQAYEELKEELEHLNS